MFALLLATATAAASSCVLVQSDRIHARDLAAAVPEVAALASDLFIGYAPQPGTERLITADHLRALLSRQGVAAGSTIRDICVAWDMVPLDPEQLISQAAQALKIDRSEIELLDWSRTPIPASGELAFTAENLRGVPNGEDTALWKGHIRYANNRRMDIWARLRIRAAYSRVVSDVDIAPGERLRADRLRLESVVGFPPTGAVNAIEAAAGRIAARKLQAGEPVLSTALAAAKDVVRGDLVRVQVRCGGARISFDGIAQSSAEIGGLVTVKNKETSKVVQARLQSPGQALLELDAQTGGR